MRIAETIAGSGTIKRPITGRYITCKSASAELEVTTVGIETVNIGQGETYDLGAVFQFRELKIRNSSTSSNTFVLEITSNELKKADNQSFVVNTTATIENGDDNQHLAKVNISAGVSAAVAAANGSRKYLRVSLLSDAVGYVTLGKSGVNASSGGTLEPGMVDYIETGGALYVHNPNASAVDVWVMEVNKL